MPDAINSKFLSVLTNDKGENFAVRLVPTGAAYGRNDCLINKGQAVVEFYLMRDTVGDERPDYLVSSYQVESFDSTVESPYRSAPLSATGLCLHGGGTYDRSYSISALNCDTVESDLRDAGVLPVVETAEKPAELMSATRLRGARFPTLVKALEGFEDISYGNDAADSILFKLGGRHFFMWVEEQDRSEREFAEASRFCVLDWNEEDGEANHDEPHLETEDAEVLVAWIRAQQ